MTLYTKVALSVATGAVLMGTPAMATPTNDFIKMRDAYVTQVKPLANEARLAWWDSATIGSDEAYARRTKADNALAALHQDHEAFAQLKALRESGTISDPSLKRQLDVMYYEYLPYQADPKLTEKIIALESQVDQIFNTHRSQVGDKQLTENDVRKVLIDTKDDQEAQKAWQGYMAVGDKVAPPLYELVKLRNEMAQQLGYQNYFVMQLDSQEFTEEELVKIFDDLDKLTIKPFTQLKGQIDQHMRQRFSLGDGPVRPWNLGDLFFQEAPQLTDFSVDSIYEGKDPVQLATKFYLSMGLDPRAIIARSDLYERPGKSPHAFEETMDREQDIRVLCNIKPNSSWMDTICHELGHGLYDQHIDSELPFLLHNPSHIMTTEGMAIMAGQWTRTRDFLDKVVGVKGEELDKAAQASWQILRAERLIFCRWTETMFHFEREMYRNPDQDLNALWWKLKQQYQLQAPPANLNGHDYAAKMHVVGAPVYYHNYMLGDLFACQLYSYIAKNKVGVKNPVDTCFYGHPEAGDYLKNSFFKEGNRYDWRELTKRVTGEALSPKAFAEIYLK